MKTRNLLISMSVAVLATINVMAADALLSPHAKDNQTAISGTNTDPNSTAANLVTVAPRVLDNQIKTVAGKSNDVNPASKCARYMTASPKAIGECASHPGAPMSCCSVAT